MVRGHDGITQRRRLRLEVGRRRRRGQDHGRDGPRGSRDGDGADQGRTEKLPSQHAVVSFPAGPVSFDRVTPMSLSLGTRRGKSTDPSVRRMVQTRTVDGVMDANDLLATASARYPMDKHVDSLSGSSFERAVIDGEPYVVKHLGWDRDWLARALGDRDCWTWTLWRTGLLAALPDCVDHTIVAMSREPATGEVVVVMRDVGPYLVPADGTALPLDQHLRFLDHMARWHAHF